MDKLLKEKLRMRLINISITQSVLRNQGSGIIEPIRKTFRNYFYVDELFSKLLQKGDVGYARYLDDLTNEVDTCRGVRWGTARKCVNIVVRETVYAGFFWQEYKIKTTDFDYEGRLNKLEVPLDSHVIKGLKEATKDYNIEDENGVLEKFTIKTLYKDKSDQIQNIADKIAKGMQVSRVNLDLFYWRKTL